MYLKRILLPILLLFAATAQAQPVWTVDPFGKEKKPKQYEEKRLPSERTGETKFKGLRRIAHNNTTRYNYCLLYTSPSPRD